MLQAVKAKKYQLRGKRDYSNFTRIAALFSRHPVLKLIAIHFHPCHPVLLPGNNCSILFYGIFLSNLFVYLVVFCNILRKLENTNFYDQP